MYIPPALLYFMGRHRARPNSTPSVSSSLPQTEPTIEPKHQSRLERWKFWKTWRHSKSNTPEPPTPPTSPISQLSPISPTLPSPTYFTSRDDSNIHLPYIARPSQARRITSLSVTTSFSNSHITEEALHDFRMSAYDLDDDLEVQMLHSATARDEPFWSSHPLAMEECREIVGGEEAEQVGDSDVNHVVGSNADGYVLSSIRDELARGGDYESAGARFEGVFADSKGAERGMIRIEIEEVSIMKQVLQS